MIEAYITNIVEKPPFKVRTMKVKVGSKVFYTPERMLTRSEIESKRRVPTYIPIYNPLIMVDVPLSLSKIINYDKSLNSHVGKIINVLESLYGDLTRLHYLIPYLVPRDKPYVDEVLRSRNKFLNVYIRSLLQIIGTPDAEYEYKTIFFPPLYMQRSEYISTLDYVIKAFEKLNIQAIPIVDLKRRDFDKVIDELLKREINVIGLKYRTPRIHFKEYYFLASEKLIDKDVMFVMVDVETHYDFKVVKDFAVMHFLPFWNIDIVSSKIYKGGHIIVDKEESYRYKFRLMKRKTLQLPLIFDLPKEEVISLLNELEIELDNKLVSPIISILSDRNIFEQWKNNIMLRLKRAKKHKNWRELRRIYDEYKSVYSLTKMQEVKASTNEFIFKKSFLRQNDLEGYLNERKQIQSVTIYLRRLYEWLFS